MTQKGIELGMKPSHPGAFSRTEVIDKLGLSVSKAAGILGVSRATPFRLTERKILAHPGNGVAYGKGVSPQHGYAAQATSLHDATELRKHAGKAKAVRLVHDSGRPVVQMARNLGIADYLLYRWRAEQRQAEYQGHTHESMRTEQEKLVGLRRENVILKQERDF